MGRTDDCTPVEPKALGSLAALTKSAVKESDHQSVGTSGLMESEALVDNRKAVGTVGFLVLACPCHSLTTVCSCWTCLMAVESLLYTLERMSVRLAISCAFVSCVVSSAQEGAHCSAVSACVFGTIAEWQNGICYRKRISTSTLRLA